MARIPYPDPESLSPETIRILELVPPLNIFRMLVHAESLAVPYGGFGAALLTQLQLDPKLRELAILQVAAQSGAEYEWVQHVDIARATGVETEQIDAVRTQDLDSPAFAAPEWAVLKFAEQVVRQPRVDDDVFAALTAHLSSREVVELLMVIGNYLMLARVMTTLDVEMDQPVDAGTIQGVTGGGRPTGQDPGQV